MEEILYEHNGRVFKIWPHKEFDLALHVSTEDDITFPDRRPLTLTMYNLICKEDLDKPKMLHPILEQMASWQDQGVEAAKRGDWKKVDRLYRAHTVEPISPPTSSHA